MGNTIADDPSNQKLLMVLEYVEGGSLFAGTKISPKKRLSELQARKYLRDVLQVDPFAHSARYCIQSSAIYTFWQQLSQLLPLPP